MGAKILGVVVNATEKRVVRYGDYGLTYGYGHSHGYSQTNGKPADADEHGEEAAELVS